MSTATATTTFGLTETARATVDGVEYVVADDGVFRCAVPADAYDDVPDAYTARDYSAWCSSEGTGIGDHDLCARIAAAAGLGGIHAAGACAYIKAAS